MKPEKPKDRIWIEEAKDIPPEVWEALKDRTPLTNSMQFKNGGSVEFEYSEKPEAFKGQEKMRVPAPLQVNNTNEHYVTCWHRYDEKAGRFVYNHYSDGLSMLERPFYKSTEQKNSWQNAVWRKTYGKLVNSTIINL